MAPNKKKSASRKPAAKKAAAAAAPAPRVVIIRPPQPDSPLANLPFNVFAAIVSVLPRKDRKAVGLACYALHEFERKVGQRCFEKVMMDWAATSIHIVVGENSESYAIGKEAGAARYFKSANVAELHIHWHSVTPAQDYSDSGESLLAVCGSIQYQKLIVDPITNSVEGLFPALINGRDLSAKELILEWDGDGSFAGHFRESLRRLPVIDQLTIRWTLDVDAASDERPCDDVTLLHLVRQSRTLRLGLGSYTGKGLVNALKEVVASPDPGKKVFLLCSPTAESRMLQTMLGEAGYITNPERRLITFVHEASGTTATLSDELAGQFRQVTMSK